MTGGAGAHDRQMFATCRGSISVHFLGDHKRLDHYLHVADASGMPFPCSGPQAGYGEQPQLGWSCLCNATHRGNSAAADVLGVQQEPGKQTGCCQGMRT